MSNRILSLDQLLQHKQSLKQQQRLMMSPQMQQAIHLLQAPLQELSSLVNAELEQNPVLENEAENLAATSIEMENEELSDEMDFLPEEEMLFSDNDFAIMRQLDEEFRDHFAESGAYSPKRQSSEDESMKHLLETTLQKKESLFDILMRQAFDTFEEEEERKAAEALIGNLDERGFLTLALEEIAVLSSCDSKRLECVLKEIQTFAPYGVGATNLQECFLIQLRLKGKLHSLAYKIVEKFFDEMLHNKIRVIQKGLKQDFKTIQEAIQRDISRLDWHPGSSFSKEDSQAIVPDILIREENGELIVDTNSDFLPQLRINRKYLRMLSDASLPLETREYIQQKLSSGKWLLRNIIQRNDTLEKIALHLIGHQREFLQSLDGKLLPMTMKTVAESLSLHESTIARAVANKYLSCPRGLVALRSFFSHGYSTEKGLDISSQTVRELLQELIGKEDKRRPLSDEVLSDLLKKRGIDCARRTIAKYRSELSIGNTTQRRIY